MGCEKSWGVEPGNEAKLQCAYEYNTCVKKVCYSVYVIGIKYPDLVTSPSNLTLMYLSCMLNLRYTLEFGSAII